MLDVTIEVWLGCRKSLEIEVRRQTRRGRDFGGQREEPAWKKQHKGKPLWWLDRIWFIEAVQYFQRLVSNVEDGNWSGVEN